MTSIEELTKLGRDLGYCDDELRQFVTNQQTLERENRAAERAHERELAIEKSRIELEQKRLESENEAKEAEREHELELEKQKVQLEQTRIEADIRCRELQLEMDSGNGNRVDGSSSRAGRKDSSVKQPKLPYFDDKVDKIDGYLSRFERYAEAVKWPRDQWALNLSALLKGKALEIYDRMPVHEAAEYHALKEALLKNYDMTEKGFRSRFRSCRPEKGETFKQFASRLSNYLDKWITLADVAKTFEGVMDFMVRDQFLSCCGTDLSIYLKTKECTNVSMMAKYAELYADAHGGADKVCKPKKDGKPVTSNQSTKFEQNKPEIKCRYCGGKHLSFKCWSKPDQKGKTTAGMQTPTNKRYRGYNDRNVHCKRDGNYDKVEQEMSFCRKIEPAEESIISEEGSCAQVGKDGICYFMQARVPLSTGLVNGQKATFMRDTGCTTVVVRSKFVKDSDLTQSSSVKLIDNTVRQHDMAEVDIDCPFFKGRVQAVCMENAIYDVVIGNVNGSKLPEAEHFCAPVITRQQERQRGNDSPLKVSSQVLELSREEFIKEQKGDDSLKHMRRLVGKGPQPCRGKANSKFQIISKNGILYRSFEEGDGKLHKQLIVPKRCRNTVLKLAHESLMGGHLGVRKSQDRVYSEFFWPGIHGDIGRYCKSCDICQRTIPKGRVPKVPLGKHPRIDVPFKRVAVDIVGPIEPRSVNKNRYILTLIDYATRYPEAVPMPNIETETVAEALVSIFSRVGIPESMLSDCGTQFTSEVMKEVSRLLSLTQVSTTPYHPMCNGLVEKLNATIKQMLKKMCAERPQDWDRYLPALMFALREVPQASTGFSPFELLYGRQVRGPMSVLRKLWTEESGDDEVKTVYQYVLDLKNRLQETCRLAQDSLAQVQGKQEMYYNKNARDRQFKVGDKVLLLLPTSRNKLLVQWKGPYEVVRVLNTLDYKIRIRGKEKTFHANMMKQYVDRVENCGYLDLVCAGSIDEPEVTSDMTFPGIERTQTYKDVKVDESLTESQVREVYNLLESFDDVLSDVPGRTSVIEHDVIVTTSEPVRSKGYRVPFDTRDIIEKEVREMLELGVIEPSKSPYSSPIVLVNKSDGSVRFCIDFRKVNKITVFDSEPMPDLESVFVKMAGNTVFSKADLTKGYWQIPLSGRAKEVTAFETPLGLFQFTVTPFGMVNSGATFCRMIRKVLDGIPNVESFVDDIWIFSKNWDDHLQTLNDVFTRLRDAGLTAKPSKCQIGKSKIDCLGHCISGNGLEPNQDKISDIVDAKRPTTKRQIRSYLGMVGFYRRFIPQFSSIALPLTGLTKKNCPNKIKEWTSQHENAFTELKRRVTNAPILVLPDFHKTFILQTDASQGGLGSVLLQEGDLGRGPVAYASRKLSTAESNFSTIEKECLAIVWAVEKFHRYLYGKSFVIEVDHEPLSYLNSAKALNARLMRWALRLQPYRFRIVYIKGSENVCADYLSRQ